MKKVLLSVLALLIMLLAVSPVMAAPATKTSFTAEAVFIPGNISLGKVWTTKDGIRHVKGAISEGTVTGDISGAFRIVSDETGDLNTGEGANHGKLVLTVDGGTFKGSFQSTISIYTFWGTFVAHGTGMYEGMKIMGTHEGELILDTIPLVEMVLEGIILSPKG